MRTAPWIVSLLAASWALCDAHADVLVELGNADQVTGTFLPASEVERYIVRLPQGARLSASVSGKTKKGAVPVMRLLAPNGDEIVTSALKPLARGAKLVSFPVPESGLYGFELRSSSAGDYAFSVKWKDPTGGKFPLDFSAVPAAVVPVHAAPGTVASFSVKAVKDPAGRPRLAQLDATDASLKLKFDAPSNPASTSHSVSGIHLDAPSSDYALVVQQTSGTGPALLTVKLVPPKTKARKVDLSSRALGTDPLSNFAQGSVLGPQGGTVAAGGFDADPLGGASVTLPPGALATPSPVLVGAAPPIAAPAGSSGAGPAVSFGPEGLGFDASHPARITLPFDADSFGGNLAGLTVLVRDARGRVSAVTAALDVDGVRATVSFPASHFSSYQVFGPVRPGRSDLNGDGIDDVVLPAPFAGEFTGAVHVVFGKTKLASSTSDQADVSIAGAGGSEFDFGLATPVGDLDDDGHADLAVWSYGFNQGYFGKLRVFKGGAGFAPQQPSDAQFEVTTAAADNGAFGGVAIGDVTGDGVADLVAGAPGRADGNFQKIGALYVVPGGVSFASTATDGKDVLAFLGTNPDVPIGNTIALGDLTGDGVADIAVAAPRGQGTTSSPGLVLVLKGGTSLLSIQTSVMTVLTGTSLGDQFGTALAIADFDGDGVNDLAVGAPGVAPSVAGAGGGAIYVFRGPLPATGTAAGASFVLQCPVPAQGYSAFGTTFVAANVLGGTARELIAGIPFANTNPGKPDQALGAGAVVVYGGGTGFGAPTLVQSASEAQGHFGCAILPCVDADGDGRLDTLVSAGEVGLGAGRVSVHLGPRLGDGGVLAIDGTGDEHLGSGNCTPSN